MPRPDSTVVTPQLLRDWPLPDPSGGKEARGSILVIGGSAETLGAVVLAAEAALRAGAGKLQVATAASVAPFAALALPEALVRGLPETDGGAIRADGVEAIRELAEAADAVLFGPGMTDKDETQEFGERLLAGLTCPTVVDALGLACITDNPGCVHHLGERVVLTPNPSELALSLHLDQEQVDEDPAGATRELASRALATVGLGGVTSWMAAPDGRLWRDDSGGDGLGVSGSGDVRAGITAGLLARGATPEQTAVWAAFLHGRAGERLASSIGSLGFLARELPREVPGALAEITG
jgi:hydroxyethylthiazole kinase-like uncharacterized protein yjeF